MNAPVYRQIDGNQTIAKIKNGDADVPEPDRLAHLVRKVEWVVSPLETMY